MTADTRDLLTGLLRDVSRSFYLTLRVLPGAIRPQIGLAYLLARTTDTIADTGVVPAEQRLGALEVLARAIADDSAPAPQFNELAGHQATEAEAVLLRRTGEALTVLRGFAPEDLQRIREVLAIITSGQALDLKRFAAARAERIVPLGTDAELEDYTYRVAGCVGEFWTRMCRAHLFPRAQLDEARLLADAVCFGKGLQLVNILRDLPHDLRQGRCFLPAERLERAGLQPSDLMASDNEPRLRPVYDELLDRAQAHLGAGWRYTNTLPWTCARVRLACAWPVLIGLRTLERLRTGRVLDASARIKATRGEVRACLIRSVLLYPFPGAWAALGAGRPAARLPTRA